MGEDKGETKRKFFAETVEKVAPKTVVPVHWDNFFRPLFSEAKPISSMFVNTARALRELKNYCESHRIAYLQQMPLTSVDF